jgi:hypothetical protein
MMDQIGYTTEDFKNPEQLLIKLHSEAHRLVIEGLTRVVYKALLEQAAMDVWQCIPPDEVEIDDLEGYEKLFGGQVSTEDERAEVSADIETLQHTHDVLLSQIRSIHLPEIPGLAEFVQSLLPEEEEPNS